MTYLQMEYIGVVTHLLTFLLYNFLGSSKYGQSSDPLFLCLSKEVQLPEYAPGGLQLSNETKPWWLFGVSRGRKTTQLCGDYFINHYTW